MLALVTVAAYQPVWRAGFIWDDDFYVTKNQLLMAPDGLRRIWFSADSPSQYFPLTYTSFYLEHALWGFDPLGYHLINILLHAINALLVWQLLRRLRVPGAWLAAALFAWHPIQVESVAWISERKNVLMGFFFLLAVWSWIRFTEDGEKPPWRFYAMSLICGALALFAKTTACTLPAALLVALWFKKQPINWRRIGQVAPFVAMGVGMGLLSIWWEKHHQGTESQTFGMGPMDRVLLASREIWFYLGKLLWPANLTFSYPRWVISASDPQAYGWLMATVGLAAAVWRAGRGVQSAMLYFVGTMSVMLGFVMEYTYRYSFVADHYVYLACIGPLALVAAVLVRRPVLAGVVLMALCVLTWRQAGTYVNAETLWKTTLRRNPGSWMAYDNLALLLAKEGKTDEMISALRAMLKKNPQDDHAHYNLGLIYLRQGSLTNAAVEFQSALRSNPQHDKAWASLGMALAEQGRMDEAIKDYRRALAIAPANAYAHNALGRALETKNKLAEAAAQYAEAIAAKPDFVEAHQNLGAVLTALGDFEEAGRQLEQALKLKPESAPGHYDLGNLLVRQGRLQDAVKQYFEALRLDPDSLEVRFNLALAFGQLGRKANAIEQFHAALRLNPPKELADQIRARLERYEHAGK